MRPSDPTWTVERAVLTRAVWGRDPRDPNGILGQLGFLDLDSGERRTVAFAYRWGDPDALERLAELKALVYPEAPGRPPPEATLEVAVELDRSLRLVRFERRAR